MKKFIRVFTVCSLSLVLASCSSIYKEPSRWSSHAKVVPEPKGRFNKVIKVLGFSNTKVGLERINGRMVTDVVKSRGLARRIPPGQTSVTVSAFASAPENMTGEAQLNFMAEEGKEYFLSQTSEKDSFLFVVRESIAGRILDQAEGEKRPVPIYVPTFYTY